MKVFGVAGTNFFTGYNGLLATLASKKRLTTVNVIVIEWDAFSKSVSICGILRCEQLTGDICT